MKRYIKQTAELCLEFDGMDEKSMNVKKLLLFLALLMFSVLPKALYAQVGPPPEMTGTPINELKTEFRPFFPDPLGFHLFPEIFSTPPNIFPSLPKIQTSPRVAVFDTITLVEKKISGKRVWARWEPAFGENPVNVVDPFGEESDKDILKLAKDFIDGSSMGRWNIYKKYKTAIETNMSKTSISSKYTQLGETIVSHHHIPFLGTSVSCYVSEVKIKRTDAFDYTEKDFISGSAKNVTALLRLVATLHHEAWHMLYLHAPHRGGLGAYAFEIDFLFELYSEFVGVWTGKGTTILSKKAKKIIQNFRTGRCCNWSQS